MSRILNLKQKTTIVLLTREEIKVDTEKISIDSVNDFGDSVQASVSFETGYSKILVLWENEEYTEIGQYTDEDVNNRILELLEIK